MSARRRTHRTEARDAARNPSQRTVMLRGMLISASRSVQAALEKLKSDAEPEGEKPADATVGERVRCFMQCALPHL